MSESAAPAWQTRKIPRVEWSTIANRYRQGESFASIARAYACTPPAIRYIVRRESQLQGSEPDVGRVVGLSGSSVKLRSVHRPAAGSSSGGVTLTGLTADLRDATTGEVANFLVAFDSALEESTGPSLKALRGATDRLLRAVARVRIALEPLVDLTDVDPAG